MAKLIMVQGTCSNAGKSLLCAALCRIFRQDGYRVAPFKSQNMALNSFITADGREMGRAQVVQAEAAGIAPDVRMNPILLKPTSDVGSQVIIMGEAHGNRTAREYWGHKKALLPVIKEAFDSLAAENDIIVIEGAGSPAEINLKQDDIVNMGLAKLVDAPVLLVGDIDRGGVFASLYGTVKLLDEDEQARIRGLVINKFRGDVEILRPGLTQLEELTGRPVVGVVPYGRFDIDDEDSLSERLETKSAPALVNIAVVKLPRLSNFTDFSALSRVPGVGVRYADRPAQMEGAGTHHPARHQVHDRGSPLAARERHGGGAAQGARGRNAGFRHLRRLSDDGADGVRPRKHRGRRQSARHRPASGRDCVPHSKDHGSDARYGRRHCGRAARPVRTCGRGAMRSTWARPCATRTRSRLPR